MARKKNDRAKKPATRTPVASIRHKDKRKNIPTEELRDFVAQDEHAPTTDQCIDFSKHDGNWSNRMILGDSLMVMTSLAEKEGLKGKVQTIYLDPPYADRREGHQPLRRLATRRAGGMAAGAASAWCPPAVRDIP